MVVKETPARPEDEQWRIVSRWREYDGEVRANLLRLLMIGVFYAIQLLHFHFWQDGGPGEVAFHRAATAIAVAWVFVGVAILLCLQQKIFPAWLKYAATMLDIVLLTALASLGAGPNSPLVFAYFLVVALTAIRMHLGLVWCGAICSMLGYIYLLGAGDPQWFGSPAQPKTAPRVDQMIFLASLGLTGLLTGQLIRRVRNIAEEYRIRVAAIGEEKADASA